MHSAVEIDRPPAQIWPWLTDPDKLTQWIAWLEEVRLAQPGDERGIGAVAIFVMNDPRMKETAEVEARVLGFDAPRRLELELEAAVGYTGTIHYSLEPVGEGAARLECDGRYVFRPTLARLMEPWVTYRARRKLTADLARLREVVTGEADAAGPA